jgi:hypothetical protein
MRGRALLTIVAPLLTHTIVTAAHGTLIAITWRGPGNSSSPLLWIDEQTGTVVHQVDVPALMMNSLAQDASGVLYTVADDQLITVDPHSGQVMPIGTLDLGGDAIRIRALAFSPSGELYAVNQPDWSQDAPPMDFYRIDALTGLGTLIGDNVMYNQSLEFSSDGVLYGYSLGPIGHPELGMGLMTIDVSTGLFTDVDPLVNVEAIIQSLTFAADGTLYGYGGTLYEVDPMRGELTPIGPGGLDDIRGLVYIPEPHCLTLFGLAWMFLCSRCRSRGGARSNS